MSIGLSILDLECLVGRIRSNKNIDLEYECNMVEGYLEEIYKCDYDRGPCVYISWTIHDNTKRELHMWIQIADKDARYAFSLSERWVKEFEAKTIRIFVDPHNEAMFGDIIDYETALEKIKSLFKAYKG